MLQSIQLKNFKAFSKSENIQFKPITLFCGTNSSGKSSLLQSLLLWKQSLESRNYDQSLLMNGRLIHLGTFANAIHKHDTNLPMGFGFTYEFTLEDLSCSRTMRYSHPWFWFMEDLIPSLTSPIGTPKFRLRYEVELISEESSSGISVVPRSIKTEAFAILYNKEIPGIKINIFPSETPSEYEMTWENLTDRYKDKDFKSKGNVHIKNFRVINLTPAEFILSNKDEPRFHAVSIIFSRIGEILRAIFGSLTYLGPLREEPARRYIYENEIVEIGIKGENAAYIYLSEGSKWLIEHYFYNCDTDSYEKKDYINLCDSVKLWLDIMGIHDFAAKGESEIIRLLLDSGTHDKTQVNIADVGFGVSQVFPIVLEGLRMNKGQTLLLEQPEIHLHPRLQMQLADYIISLALSGKNVILETHSDHIVNRLVRRMIEDSKLGIAALIAIYFVRQTPEGSIVEPISLSEKEGIVNWPEEFFDQAALEQQHIMRAIINKQKGK
jgi:predicted ATPase